IGTGSQMMDEVEMLAMDFQFFNTLEIDEARNLVISAVNEYLAEINNNQALRPYLVNYPFEAKNLIIDIWMRNPDRSSPAIGQIQLVSAFKGIIKYRIKTQNAILGKIIHSETYEEAINRLNEKKSYKI
ncbi:MAG TPA: hypothetical protein VLG49_05870, partial [Rhabdochlamydiaceae bacterium]|nr:hypothetical protein [Rhabdochlamydiaceae bacterium]